MAQQFEPPRASGATDATNMAAQKPIGDAVTTAMDKSDIQDLDPGLVAQITQNVINQLRQVNLQSTPSSQTASPTGGRQAAFPPPSPTSTTARSSEPDAPSRGTSDRATGSRSPTNTRPQKHTEYATVECPPLRSEPSPKSDTNTFPRPKGPERLSTSTEETPLEKIWGVLFDEEGTPTPRVNQLLRGLALHLVEDYEPKNSLVITPAKMAKYYRECKLEKEFYPWKIIFDDEETYISRMYRELGCSHHLIQESIYERPEIPGLTPPGFAQWMTLMLLAHPDEEFERLKLSVVNMPISNPDDRKERYPKDITKRLFPSDPDAKSRNSLRRAIRKHSKNANIDPPDDEDDTALKADSSLADSFGSVLPPRAPLSASSDLPIPPIERERQPYRASTGAAPSVATERIPTVGPAGESAIADDDHTIPLLPIERERKPYYATPGGGKNTTEPASGRSHYPMPSAPPAPGTNVYGNSPPTYPPPPRQTSSGPPPNQHGLNRSNSLNGRPPMTGVAGNGIERGPPPAPSAGTSTAVPMAPEIHQHQPPGIRSRHGSFTRRRAPSIGRTYHATDSRPISIGDDPRNPQATFQPSSYEPPRPVYVERAGGHDGYGTYEDEANRRARGNSVGQAMGGFSIPAPGPEIITSTARRQSIERRRSPPKTSWAGGRDSPTRRSWAGAPGEESYREAGRY